MINVSDGHRVHHLTLNCKHSSVLRTRKPSFKVAYKRKVIQFIADSLYVSGYEPICYCNSQANLAISVWVFLFISIL